MAEDLGVRRLLIDAELLSRLGPGTPRAAWERDLRRTGLYDLDPPDGPVGDTLRELRRTVREWPAEVASPSAAFPPWFLPACLGGSFGATFWLLGFGPIGLVIGLAVGLGVNAAVPKPAPTMEPAPYAERGASLLRSLLARTFVAAAGEVVVENTPHVDYLRLRAELLEGAIVLTDRRVEDANRTLRQVQLANTRMGRPEEDVETDRLRELIAREEQGRVRIMAVQETVSRRLDEVLARLAQLRAAAERQALSERVQRMSAGDHRVAQHVAEVEVDISEVELAIRALALDARDADARTTALLEVVGAGSTWSPSRSSAKVRDSERA